MELYRNALCNWKLLFLAEIEFWQIVYHCSEHLRSGSFRVNIIDFFV